MRIFSAAAVAAVLAGGIFAGAAPANARMADPGLKLPSAVESVACRTVRERVHRPGGAVVWRSRRVCTPEFVRPRPRCWSERQRVVRPNGTVIFRSVRRCR
ncbi:hypothetical protein [Bradyrhizobium sp. LHD-71]|uniref:hypothetical protein n=1 Tax=Bradyrhizobium sp. LHD-71 TaxID=3072141 RepID=UPI00280F7AEF|nr:hypothetical protein [Bradyrhizobium sp. LHD-71]MDQ8728123.1 hypothetical protein [Bradyrhizobium sp. LHD-71]